MSGSTPRSPRRRWPAAGATRSRSSSARRSRRAAATCSASSSDDPIRPWRSLRRHDRRDPRAGRPGHPGPSRSCRTPCAPRRTLLRLLADPDPPSIPTPSRCSTRRPSAAAGIRRSWPFAAEHGLPGSATATPTRWTRSARAGPPSRAAPRTTCAGPSWPGPPAWHGDFHPPSPSSACSGASSASRPRHPRRCRRPPAAATAPAATTAIPAAAGGRRAYRDDHEDERGRGAVVKIGLVTPYVYPLPGRRQRARPVPLREPPAARPRRPDHHQQPRPPARQRGRRDPPREGLQRAHQRLGRHAHALAALPVAGRPVLDREQFDLLHFHEPFVPFLSPILLRESERERRHVPRLRRLVPGLPVIGRAVRGSVAAAPRPDRRQRRRAPLHRPLLPGRLQGHPQRRRPVAFRVGPCRSPAGRTARRTSSSSAASRRARACPSCSRPTASCAARGAPAGSSSSAPGRRSARPAATS